MSTQAPTDSAAAHVNALMVPVADMEAACTFLTGVLGLALKFRDGDRYAAFELQGLTLALLGQEERVVTQPAIGIRVDDMEGTITRMQAAGAAMATPVTAGPHELRGVVRMPGGIDAVLSQKTAR